MASDFDETDFVDADFQASRKSPFAAPPAMGTGRPPTREELDTRVGEAQQKLVELRRQQEELERERSSLEEARRRRTEFGTGREEMLQHLTRGIGLLEESEFNARRDAEQIARTLNDLRESLLKLQGIREDAWSAENYNVELTRALKVIENARMEWNSARLKWTVLNGATLPEQPEFPESRPASPAGIESLGLGTLFKLGFALTWPVAVALLGAVGVLTAVLLRR
jgi:hypothetical protein